MKEIDTMTIIGEDGVEQEVRVLFTFEDNNKHYAVFEFSDTEKSLQSFIILVKMIVKVPLSILKMMLNGI